jgi:hypothetical protein
MAFFLAPLLKKNEPAIPVKRDALSNTFKPFFILFFPHDLFFYINVKSSN